MKLKDFPHLPIVRGSVTQHRETDLPEVPVELAEVEFEGKGAFRPIYVCGINVIDEDPDRPFLVWTNHVNKETGKRWNVLSTYLDNITAYRPVPVEKPVST